jgi:hypothetical protein
MENCDTAMQAWLSPLESDPAAILSLGGHAPLG